MTILAISSLHSFIITIVKMESKAIRIHIRNSCCFNYFLFFFRQYDELTGFPDFVAVIKIDIAFATRGQG